MEWRIRFNLPKGVGYCVAYVLTLFEAFVIKHVSISVVLKSVDNGRVLKKQDCTETLYTHVKQTYFTWASKWVKFYKWQQKDQNLIIKQFRTFDYTQWIKRFEVGWIANVMIYRKYRKPITVFAIRALPVYNILVCYTHGVQDKLWCRHQGRRELCLHVKCFTKKMFFLFN